MVEEDQVVLEQVNYTQPLDNHIIFREHVGYFVFSKFQIIS